MYQRCWFTSDCGITIRFIVGNLEHLTILSCNLHYTYITLTLSQNKVFSNYIPLTASKTHEMHTHSGNSLTPFLSQTHINILFYRKPRDFTNFRKLRKRHVPRDHYPRCISSQSKENNFYPVTSIEDFPRAVHVEKPFLSFFLRRVKCRRW